MIRLNKKAKISLVEKTKKEKENVSPSQTRRQISSTYRPKVVDAKVYKVKSAFVKNSVFITLSYIVTEDGRKPIEIFVKDAVKETEVLTTNEKIEEVDPKELNSLEQIDIFEDNIELIKTNYENLKEYRQNENDNYWHPD